MIKTRIPAECFPPAVYIREEGGSRGLDLRHIMADDVDQLALDLVLGSNVPIGDLAEAISDALGEPRIEPQFWLNLDRAWRECKAQKGEKP